MTMRIFQREGDYALSRYLMDVTHNERAWIEFIQMISDGTDPAPTLARIQGLRLILRAHAQSKVR